MQIIMIVYSYIRREIVVIGIIIAIHIFNYLFIIMLHFFLFNFVNAIKMLVLSNRSWKRHTDTSIN